MIEDIATERSSDNKLNWGMLIFQNNKKSNMINSIFIFSIAILFLIVSILIFPQINHLIINQPINNPYERTIASIVGIMIGISLLLRGNPGIPLKVYTKGILFSTNPIRLLFNKPLFIPFNGMKKISISNQYRIISILSDNTNAIIKMDVIDDVDNFIKSIKPHLNIQIIFNDYYRRTK